jgi:dienelactone hydrolase
MLTRREALKLSVASCLSAGLAGCVTQLSSCPIGWVPTMLAPVFYGYKDYVACQNIIDCATVTRDKRLVPSLPPPAPPDSNLAIRIYYPSLDGSPQNAAILSPCRRFPLVNFIHGDCGGDPYQQWLQLPAQLARCGYVVMVTNYGGILATGDPAQTAPLRTIQGWVRNHWEHKDRLMPSPSTAVMGHSYGGTLAGQLATEIPVMAFVSLSGTFGQASNWATLLSSIAVPALCLWNDNDDAGLNAQLFRPDLPPAGQPWTILHAPKHAVIFRDGQHADYMQANTAVRCAQGGPCGLVRTLAADFVSAFLSKYMPPEFGSGVVSHVPDNLFVRPQDLPARTFEQEFYAGSFLNAFAGSKLWNFPANVACRETLMWQTPASTGQTYLIPA